MARQTITSMKVIAKKAGCSRSHVITFMKRLGIEHVGALGNQYYYTVTDAEAVVAKIREEKKAPVRQPAAQKQAGGEVVTLLRRIAEGIDALVARRQRPAKGNHVPVANVHEDAEGRMMEFLADKQLAKAGDIFAHMHPSQVNFSGARWTHMNACLEALGWRKEIEKRPGGGRHAIWYQGSAQ